MLSSQEFYNHDILEYIQAEHIAAMSPLVEVLKNGKKRVTKKALQEQPEYKMSKEFIYDFCNKHPEIIGHYKKRKDSNSGLVPDLNDIDESYIAKMLIQRLQAIKAGGTAATLYHNLAIGILEFLFFPHWMYPKKEHELHSGRKRIDVTFQNAAETGVFSILRTSPKIAAGLIMIECKNYSSDIKNPELDQMAGRFSNLRGWFGIILSRRFDNKELFLERCKDTAKDGRGIILCLDDDDITNLLSYIQEGKRNRIDKDITQRYQAVIS